MGIFKNFSTKKHFIPYGTDPAKDAMVDSAFDEIRLEMAIEGYGLNILVKDRLYPIREAVARQGYKLNILVKDESEWVRKAVAEQGYKLNVLIKDESSEVRAAVAEQGYGLDILVNDEFWLVREAVAKQGYGLDVLINDKNDNVRIAVADQGYGLDVLIEDKKPWVRKAVLNYLKENNLTLAEWCERNNKEIYLGRLASLPYLEVQEEAIRSGYEYKIVNNSINENKINNVLEKKEHFIPYGTDPEKDKMVKSDWWNRLEMANQGYGLDILVDDESWAVREAVAKQGYGLDVLIDDKNFYIRTVVADQGYGLNVLINDKDYNVQKAVLKYLKKNNLTLTEWCERNNKEVDLKTLAFSPYPEVRKEAVRSIHKCNTKQIIKTANNSIDENKINNILEKKEHFTPYGTDPEKDKMVDSNDYWDRLGMAKEGYGLDILINDENYHVRKVVAGQGYGLNILINDKNKDVRKTVLDYLKTRSMTLSQWANYEEKSLDLNELLNSPYEEVRLEAFRCVYRDSIDNLKNVGFSIDFKDMKDVKDHIFDDPTTCIKALRFLGDESVKSDEKYKEVLSILVSKSEELKRDHTSFPEKFNSFIKNGPYSVFKDFEKVRNNSLDINDPSISRFNTMKLEIQNLKNQISILAKENKSLQETLEKYVSVEKETDEKEL